MNNLIIYLQSQTQKTQDATQNVNKTECNHLQIS